MLNLSPRAPGRLRAGTLAALNCFIVLGALGVYLKLALLEQQWEAVARFLGKSGEPDLTGLEKLGYFFNDIALNLVILPVAATALVSLLRPRYRAAAALAVSVALSLFYFTDLRAQAEVGQYISGAVIQDMVGWAVSNPGASTDYLTTASVTKLFALLAALIAIAGLATFLDRAERRSPDRAVRWPRRLLELSTVGGLGVALLVAPVAFAVRQHNSPLNVSAVSRAFTALFDLRTPQEISSLTSVEQVLEATRQLTRTPGFDAANRLVGRERGANVIVFMMETAPALAFDLAAVGRDLPGTGPLFEHAFVAEQHHTTHPYSSDAMYSILSGLYPQGRQRLLRYSRRDSLNALMSALEPDTPVRRVYLPSLYWIELDDKMYAAFGAETLYSADQHTTDAFRQVADRRVAATIADLERNGSRFDPVIREALHDRLRADFQALEKMKADITAAVQADQRFCVMFFPEIGHAPWLPLYQELGTLERGRALARLQDSWLQEIVETLRHLGRLDETVIALTADHGIRTRVEDPTLPTGKISDYTFRVPFLVYAPRTLQQTQLVRSPTSHIDVAPTLLALLGYEDNVRRMQGVPIWQRGSSDRLYFLASTYGGADGFTQDGMSYMRQALAGTVYRSSSLSFIDENVVSPDDPVASFVTEALSAAEALQHALVARMLAEHP